MLGKDADKAPRVIVPSPKILKGTSNNDDFVVGDLAAVA
jgi:hypothetical protein